MQLKMQTGGLRERKRRDTMQRIADRSMELFIERGYDATTLDDIATGAGISRRTFFYYYKSKDDILLSLQSGMGELLATAVRAQPAERSPILAMRDVLVKAAEAYPTDRLLAIDRVMRASASVQARKSAAYVEHEQTLLAGLRERWPAPEKETWLRLVAMLSIGTIRLSLDTFNRESGARSLAQITRELFDALDAGIGVPPSKRPVGPTKAA